MWVLCYCGTIITSCIGSRLSIIWPNSVLQVINPLLFIKRWRPNNWNNIYQWWFAGLPRAVPSFTIASAACKMWNVSCPNCQGFCLRTGEASFTNWAFQIISTGIYNVLIWLIPGLLRGQNCACHLVLLYLHCPRGRWNTRWFIL